MTLDPKLRHPRGCALGVSTRVAPDCRTPGLHHSHNAHGIAFQKMKCALGEKQFDGFAAGAPRDWSGGRLRSRLPAGKIWLSVAKSPSSGILSVWNQKIARKLECRKIQDTCREGSRFGCPERHQIPIRARLDRFCINGESSSGNPLPIVSMMQATDARE
jgi:hypothetical protein